MPNWGAGGSGAAKGAAIGTSIMPGWGTAIGAGVGFIGGLFKKKSFNQQDYAKAAQSGGYVTVPPGGIPGHPEWKPGTRQWIPPGSPVPDEKGNFNSGGSGGMEASNINYDAIRERSIAPTRAVYQNAMRGLNRQRSMSGGYGPGYGAQLTALSRGMSSDMSDAATGAEAEISKLRLQEMGMGQEAQLRNRELDIREKQGPSDLQRGLSTTGQVLDLIGRGADIYAGSKA